MLGLAPAETEAVLLPATAEATAIRREGGRRGGCPLGHSSMGHDGVRPVPAVCVWPSPLDTSHLLEIQEPEDGRHRPPPPPPASRFLCIAGGSLWKKSPKTGTSVRPGCTSCTRRRSVRWRLWGARGHLGLRLSVSRGALGSWRRWREPCSRDRTAHPSLTRPDAPRGDREKSVAKYFLKGVLQRERNCCTAVVDGRGSHGPASPDPVSCLCS